MANPLSELLARGEGGYGSYNRGRAGDANGDTIDFSQMTLGEVQRRQGLPRQDPERLFAVGKYQVIPGTLDLAVRGLRLDPAQPFTPELQERIFSEYLISQKQPGIRAYITGQPGATLQQAQQQLANEWASVADPETGLSVHGRVGNNRASISADQAAQALDAMRTRYAESIRQGMSPADAWGAVTSVDPAAQRRDGAAPRPADPMADGVLRRDERGQDVAGLQRSLNALGVRDAQGNRLGEDGVFGQRTEQAVRAFQRDNGLREDGIAGPRTLAAIGRLLPEGTVTVERAEVTGPADARRTEGAGRVDPATRTPLVTEAAHPNNPLFAAIQRQLPDGTRPEVVANITLQALENGITSPDRLRGVAVSGSNVHLQGPYEGARVSVDLNAPTPDLRAMSEHMARQSDEQTREQSRMREQDARPLPPVISV